MKFAGFWFTECTVLVVDLNTRLSAGPKRGQELASSCLLGLLLGIGLRNTLQNRESREQTRFDTAPSQANGDTKQHHRPPPSQAHLELFVEPLAEAPYE